MRGKADDQMVALLREAVTLTESQHARAAEILSGLETRLQRLGCQPTELARVAARALLAVVADELDLVAYARVARLFDFPRERPLRRHQ